MSLKNSLNNFQSVKKLVRPIENHIHSIQHQSSSNQARQIQTKFLNAISVGRAIGSIDRKSRKNQFFFFKQCILMQKLLKAHYFMKKKKKKHEYKMNCFSKTP